MALFEANLSSYVMAINGRYVLHNNKGSRTIMYLLRNTITVTKLTHQYAIQ